MAPTTSQQGSRRSPLGPGLILLFALGVVLAGDAAPQWLVAIAFGASMVGLLSYFFAPLGASWQARRRRKKVLAEYADLGKA